MPNPITLERIAAVLREEEVGFIAALFQCEPPLEDQQLEVVLTAIGQSLLKAMVRLK